MRTLILAAVAGSLLPWPVPSAAAADAAADAVQKELAKLQGTWQLISAETDGKKTPEEQLKNVRVVIRGNSHSVSVGEQTVAKEVRFTIDPSKSPKTTDDTLADGRVIRGIYELDGDTLRSCVAPIGQERPKEFSAKAGSGHTLRVFRRVPQAAGARADGERLRGTWVCVSAVRDGQPVAAATVQKLRLVLTADKYATYRGDELLFESVYKLDPAKSPGEIDIIGTEGETKGRAAQGIYALDGESLKLCYTMPGKERPKDFASQPGSGASLTLWKRAKP